MLLSEAIREGCKKSKPHERGYVSWDYEGNAYACAYGAAAVACGYTESMKQAGRCVRPLVEECLGINDHLAVIYPGASYENDDFTLHEAIVALNDKDEWSREQIADWLESIGY